MRCPHSSLWLFFYLSIAYAALVSLNSRVKQLADECKVLRTSLGTYIEENYKKTKLQEEREQLLGRRPRTVRANHANPHTEGTQTQTHASYTHAHTQRQQHMDTRNAHTRASVSIHRYPLASSHTLSHRLTRAHAHARTFAFALHTLTLVPSERRT